MFSFAEKESSCRGLLAACKKHEASSVGCDASASVCEFSLVHLAELARMCYSEDMAGRWESCLVLTYIYHLSL